MSLPTLGRKGGLFTTETQRLAHANDHLYERECKNFSLVCQAFFLNEHVFEQIVSQQASRLFSINNSTDKELQTITKDDIPV